MQTDPFGNPPQRPSLDPYLQTSSTSARTWARAAQIGLGLVGLAICLRVGGLWNWSREAVVAATKPDAQATATETPAPHPAAALQPIVSDDFEDDSLAPRERTTGRFVLANDDPPEAPLDTTANRTGLANLQSLVETWQTAASNWEQSVAALMENETGRKLAADPARLRQFRAVCQQAFPTATRLQFVRDQLSTMQQAISARGLPAIPLDTFAADLASLTAESNAAGDTYGLATRQLQALLEVVTTPAGTSTLREALAELERSEVLASVAALEQRLAAAQREADEQVAAAKESAVRSLGQVEARQILAATEAARTEQAAAEAAQRAAAAQAERRAAMKRELKQIKHYLSPFITDGYAQPNGWHNASQGESQPVSWSKLAASGALKPTREGMEQLMRYATVNNDREHGGFPQYIGSEWAWQEVDKSFLKRAQELLTEHGDVMVEEGLLSP